MESNCKFAYRDELVSQAFEEKVYVCLMLVKIARSKRERLYVHVTPHVNLFQVVMKATVFMNCPDRTLCNTPNINYCDSSL